MNAFRSEPLPLRGEIGPPPEEEPGADLVPLTPEDARVRGESGAVFVDVREVSERVGGAAGAVAMPAAEFPGSYYSITPPLDPAIPLTVYGAGPDSFAVRRIVAELSGLGHLDVQFVTCGWNALAEVGIPGEGS